MTPSPVSEALKSWPRRLRALSIPLSLVAATTVLHGCSLAYDLSTNQCSVNADCASIGEGLICGPQHVCEIDNSGCATNTECLDDPNAVSLLSACIKDPTKDPAKTRGVCTSLTTAECQTVLPADTTVSDRILRDADRDGQPPVIFGAFTNLNLGPLLYNYDLAVNEFRTENGGIYTQAGTRPVLMVACNGTATDDTTGDFQASLDHAMDHLIELHVPGVVSGLEVDDLKRVFEQKGKAADMFFMSSGESDSSLGVALKDNGLVWEELPGGTGLAKAYKPLVDRTIAYLQYKGTLTGDARIALVSTPDISLLSDMANTVQSDPADGGIFFNGKNVVENGDNFHGFATQSSIANKDADLSTTVTDLLALKPHIIISAGASEFFTKIMVPLEDQWDANAGGQARPFYMLSPYQYNRSGLTNAITARPSIRQRVIGLNAPSATDPTIYTSYISRYKTAYNPPTNNYDGYENFYDSAYYMLYAASASNPPLTGSNIAAGMFKLLDGPVPYKVGPNDMGGVIDVLSRGAKVTLVGAGGPPNFNTATGGKDDAASVWCVDSTMTTRPDVLRYQASDGTMQGNFPCFIDF
jgi:hypothetical protein